MTYTNLFGFGPSGAYIAGDKWGYQDSEWARQNFRALTAIRHILPLGGSRNQGLQHNAVIEAYDYLDIEIDSTELPGLSCVARVEVRVENAGLSVTPSIRNVTDSSDAGTGLACTATSADYSGTNQKQEFEVTLASGVKKYRLRLTPTNNTYQFWAIGYLEIYYDGDLAVTITAGAITYSGGTLTPTIA